MKALVTDREALGAIRPLDLVAYLRAQKWTTHDTASDEPCSEWTKEIDGELFEVQVPRHNAWRDYAKRVSEVLALLSEAEDRSQLEILHDVPLVSRDIVRLRSMVQGRSDGTMPLSDGALIAQAARNMMLAAACSTVEPRRAWPARKPVQATTYLSELSLGQTERGSFVMTLLAPVPPSLIQQMDFGFGTGADGEPFNRRVTRRLGTALEAVRRAAEVGVATGDLSAFEAGVDLGVSADFCEALALVRECASVSEFEIRIGWASTRPPIDPPPSLHELAPDTLEVIREAGRVLRERTPVEDFEIEGPVVKVDRPGDELFGTAVVLGSVDGRSRKIHLAVSGEDWNIANEAMAARSIRRCRGDLVREGKRFAIVGVRGLRVVPSDE